MPCNHYVYRNSNTGLFYIAKSGDDFFLYSDCDVVDSVCDICSLEDSQCQCYPLENYIVPTGIGYRPPGEEPPTSGYFLPRYAYITLGGSSVVTIPGNRDTLWEIWTPSGEAICDTGIEPFGAYTEGVGFNAFSTGISLIDPDSCQLNSGNLTVSWNGTGWNVNLQFSTTCDYGEGNEYCSGGLVFNGQPLQVRWRREYEDWITKESQVWTNVSQVCDVVTTSLTLAINFVPTCRPPATGTYCNCVDEAYNVIQLSTLDTYSAPAETGVQCLGKPIDIDTTCGNVESMTSWVLYYAPYPDTVPVISGVAYDTTNIVDGAGIEVVEIATFQTQQQARTWVCNYLKFATVGNSWPTDPDDLEYNWPYNDLYFNACAGNTGSINLIPC